MDRRKTVEAFRARLGEVIERAGLSRMAFAARVGLDRSTLSQLLSPGNERLPRAETIAAIAAREQVSVDWLLGLSQEGQIGADIVAPVLEIESGAASAGALSAHALINSLSRAFGGALATWIDPKWLLVTALLAETIGMLALASADNMTTIVLFAIGEGYGFGMCIFSTTMLLVNYYGPKEAPKTMGTMYLITTIAMLGPVMGGYVADNFGGFEGVFRAYAVVLAVCLVAVAFMRPPMLPKVRGEQAAAPDRLDSLES